MPPIPSWPVKEEPKLIEIETLERRHSLMRLLDEEYQKMWTKHYEESKEIYKGGRIPIGGGENWMDLLFKAEGLRGTIGGLRLGYTVERAIEDGIAVSEISVSVWNNSRKKEYQVHRWGRTAEDYIRYTVKRLIPKIDEELIEWAKWLRQLEHRKKMQELKDEGKPLPLSTWVPNLRGNS